MLVNFNLVRWQKHGVIGYDIASYYSYLSALFVEKDLSLSFLDDELNSDVEQRYYKPNRTASGNYVIKTSMGMAIGYLPFFLLAHFFALVFNYDTNGFSEPYHFAVLFSSTVYIGIGLFCLRRVLKKFFSERAVSLSLLTTGLGTNVFHYLTDGGGNAHTFLFFLCALFIRYTIRWHEELLLKDAIRTGITGGMMVLARPVDGLIFIFFLLYGVRSFGTLKEKLRLLASKPFYVLAACLICFATLVPQLLYWRYFSGSYVFNSYVGEQFFFNNPHILEGLFGFRKGWLVYTPAMLFALAGFFFLKRKSSSILSATVIFLLVYVFVIFSWWCWWYGGSFGARAMIDVYPLLAFPMAAFYSFAEGRGKVTRYVVYGLTVFFILLNFFQSIQAHYNIIHYDSMTRQSYFRHFFDTSKRADREEYLDHPDYEKALKGEDTD